MAGENVVKGNPSKGFFINMITRDISLNDAILDLLDNCVDGIRRAAGRNVPDFSGYFANIEFSPSAFRISDNCGGIPIKVAKAYAFRFGKPEDVVEQPAPHSIGLYGIGMKRTLFKMGEKIRVNSSTGQESFTVEIDVPRWRKQPENDWDFQLTDVHEGKTAEPIGTRISVTDLYQWISAEFEAPTFANGLVRSIQRDYAFILERGFKVDVNKIPVRGRVPTLRTSELITPIKTRYVDEGVDVEITAGMSVPPPEDDSPDEPFPEQELYGWYVVCNDRVVVTADKSPLTGWGADGLPAWHAQYFGFIGIVRFDSDNPQLLPWRTTKRDIDNSSPVYKRALVRMREISKQFTQYTNQRKSEMKRSRETENLAKSVSVSKLEPSELLVLPKLRDTTMARICYDKPVEEIRALAVALGIKSTAYKKVGIATFDYAREREIRK